MTVPERVPIGRTLTEFPGGSFNALVDEFHRQRRGRVGSIRSFLNAVINVIFVEAVAIVEDFGGATWSASANERTVERIDVHPFIPKPNSAGKDGIYKKITQQVVVGLAVPGTTVTAGKYKVGQVIAGTLINVQCEEWDLPTNWESDE